MTGADYHRAAKRVIEMIDIGGMRNRRPGTIVRRREKAGRVWTGRAVVKAAIDAWMSRWGFAGQRAASRDLCWGLI